ncbi:2-C-methyl-D-erythritol 4-phosphate cytidylyltransferase [Thorsellia anophelis DSM 18579]|uniref:2-C-methyl-D-erythritol 4-phosphate cytidylyltransferase n=2 Tax=Thorsellia anophelis TaxID=336804 RepID=A0A1I0CA12_9GAMM|nr:2-C-methyl-D-erythritol 4-phosphate cytidylyltransferase [Thorsellia anophelis DSM 18579]
MTDKTPLSNIVAIIPAAGIGKRMGSMIPKQYINVAGKTILEHTVSALMAHPAIDTIIIAVAQHDTTIQTLPFVHNPSIHIVIGGEERSDSVYSALNFAKKNLFAKWALVHDAARPLIAYHQIDKLLSVMSDSIGKTEGYTGAILALPVKDTIKQGKIDNHTTCIDKTLPRTLLWAAQTPQLFPVDILHHAIEYCHDNQHLLTDEASAIEMMGLKIRLVEGVSSNIKLTEPDDLAYIKFMLMNQLSE